METDGEEEIVRRTVAAYNEAAERYQEYWGQFPLAEQMARFCALLPAAAKVLDVGCGGGRDIKEIVQCGVSVFGLDRSRGMLRVALRSTPPGRLLQADMRVLPFAPASFDGIWASATLVHLPRRLIPTTLTNWCRCLHPGGAIYLSVKEGTGEKWIVQDPELVPRQRFYTFLRQGELLSWLQAANCSPVAVWQNPGPPGALPWLNILARPG